ncbi:MAG TPA: hypothetical protein VGO93_12080 [Candidatus Xenobia bacterium]|jgi:hypothetical protein
MKRLLITGLVLAMLGPLQAAEPGSPQDPLISRSYLESLYAWQYTNLAEGQTISLDVGSTVVIRKGQAVVVGNEKEGLIDLTAGKELLDGEVIPPLHLILSPASDRRGMKAVSAVVAMTRGQSK